MMFDLFKGTHADNYLQSEEFIERIRQNKYDDSANTYTPEDIVKTWHLDLAKDYDVVVAITGYEGSGKSTFAVLLAELALARHGYKYTFPKNPREFLEALNDETIKVIIIDEAVANLYSRNAMTRENKQFVTLLTMCRSKNKIMLFLIPRLRNIDIYMRGDRIFQWFEIRERNSETNTGGAFWFMRDMNDFANTETFDLRTISFAIQRATSMNLKSPETEKLIRENLFCYVSTYMGYIRYKVNENIKKITLEHSEKLKNENIHRAEMDFYEMERNNITTKLKKKIENIRIITGFNKLLKETTPINNLITQDDVKALNMLKMTMIDSTFNTYDFDAFSKFTLAENGKISQLRQDKLNFADNNLDLIEGDGEDDSEDIE